jgi:hypothetical protein
MIGKPVIWGLAFFLTGSLLMGQDKEFTASAPAAVSMGQQFQYVVEGPERGDVLLPSMTEFQLIAGPFTSFSSSSQWINGKMSMKTVASYTHVLRPLREGTFTIPPTTVRVGRKEYKTNEVQIVVTAGGANAPPSGTPGGPGQEVAPPGGSAGADEDVFLRVIPSKREVYVGEQLVSGLKVYTRVNTRPAAAGKDIPYEGFYKISVDPDANAQRQEIDGQQYVSQTIQRHILIPQKTGELVIEPYESEWMVPQRVQRRSSNNTFDDFFNDPFFDNFQDVPITLSTPQVTIRVKPLPAGAPEGFNGAVGDFTMNSSLSSTEVGVNEALSLKITIRGTGNLPLLGEPAVNLPPDHDIYDVTKSLQTSTSGNRISGSVTFEYPIVARHAGRFRIAPIKFSWFDPATGQYHQETTEEYTFTVLKGETEEGQGGVYVPGISRESVENIGTDIRDISRAPQQFTPLAVTLLGKGWARWFYPLALFVAIVVILLIRLLVRRNADLTLVRNRKANRSARIRLKKADRFRKANELDKFYEEVGKALWGYLADKLDIETFHLSREAILEELEQRSIDEDLQKEFLRILDDSEFSRFAPTSEKSNVDQLYADAATIIRNLENKL